MSGRLHRLYVGETTIDFFGRRRIGFYVSGLLLVVAVFSMFAQGLNLGIDFKGGVAFEAPAASGLTVAKMEKVVRDAGLDLRGAKIQTLSSGSDQRIRLQLGDLPTATVTAIKEAIGKSAGVDQGEVSVATVSSTWGRSITNQAIFALLVFLGLVSVFITWRFQWAMALGAIIAMLHDIGVSVGVYSLLQLEVTPATVVAFLTILGYSLYDTIVVFDKVDENVERFASAKVSFGDIINVSMNQVLMRSLNTSISALLPVLSLFLLGSIAFGAVALQEFAVALLVGLATGAYSSIFIAAPILGVLKERTDRYRPYKGQVATGSDMAHLMSTGAPVSRRAHQRPSMDSADAPTSAPANATVEAILSHPPRPRKKSRR